MRIMILIFSFLLLTSCALYQPEVQQGNVITKNGVSRLHLGMRPDQVKKIMGTPVLQNTFADSRMNYVYTFQTTKGKMTQKKLVLTFRHQRLIAIQ